MSVTRRPARPYTLAFEDDRMQRLETAVDAIAIEVKRISEAQRFMVGLLSEPPAGAAGELAPPDLAVLRRTIELQRPRLIITLGRFVPALLARLAPTALAGWGHGAVVQRDRHRGVVAARRPNQRDRDRDRGGPHAPSLRAANGYRRRYASATGGDVDRALLAEAYRK